MPPAVVNSGDLLAAVVAERQQSGQCTVRGLATRLGISVGAAQNAIARAVSTGLLTQTPGLAGSLRPTTAVGATMRVELAFTLDPESGRVIDVALV